MHAALERREFVAYFQPKVDLDDHRIIGAEALVRWRHPKLGLIPPGDFIPFFERNGFVTKLDLYMFEQACRCQRALLDEGIEPAPVSVNFSRRHLRAGDWSEKLIAIAEKYGLSTRLFELELTETVAEEDFGLVVAASQRIKSRGFALSIDDFGSGYSSVQLLYRIPIDVLKLDKSCLSEKGARRIEREIVKSIIQIALDNGIRVIWEGIETPAQEAFIRQYGCRYAQGYLYWRPMPFEEYARLLKEQNARAQQEE